MKIITGTLKNKMGVTLFELVVMITILVVVGTIALIKINRSVKDSYIAQERALVLALTKAAINYNTQNDSWYGQTFSEDIFNGLLDNPPPHQLFNNDFMAWAQWSTDRKTWKLSYMSGASPYWLVACPHQSGLFNSTGSSWMFYVKGGKIVPWMDKKHIWP